MPLFVYAGRSNAPPPRGRPKFRPWMRMATVASGLVFWLWYAVGTNVDARQVAENFWITWQIVLGIWISFAAVQWLLRGKLT